MAGKPLMIVGTSAPQRRELMRQAFGTEFELEFLSPDIDERIYRSSDPVALTGMIAGAKMDAVLAQLAAPAHQSLKEAMHVRPGSVAVTFDQVVVWNGQIREKPADVAQAASFVRDYSGSRLATVQTTCVYLFERGDRVLSPNETMTYYREITDAAVDRVVRRGVCLRTAGAFVIEDPDMQASMIKIDPGTTAEVQGVCERTVREGITKLLRPA